jgi:hypothetical protein
MIARDDEDTAAGNAGGLRQVGEEAGSEVILLGLASVSDVTGAEDYVGAAVRERLAGAEGREEGVEDDAVAVAVPGADVEVGEVQPAERVRLLRLLRKVHGAGIVA